MRKFSCPMLAKSFGNAALRYNAGLCRYNTVARQLGILRIMKTPILTQKEAKQESFKVRFEPRRTEWVVNASKILFHKNASAPSRIAFSSSRSIHTSHVRNFHFTSNSIFVQASNFSRLDKLYISRRAMTTQPNRSWIEYAPAKIQPYLLLARLDKPIGTWLLLWPCCWSIAIAAPMGSLPDFMIMTQFAIGAFVMRGAGCTINDLWDQDIDSKVERTKSRPLAAGSLTQRQAIVFLGLQLTAGLGVLLSLNTYSIVLGAASMGLVVTYPLMKRITNWPQLYLGLTFNWGALLGAAAVLGHCPWAVCLPLYAGSVAWTVFYDTIYAHQDKEDDRRVGVRSTALHFGDGTKSILAAFGGCFIAGLCAAGWAAGLGPAYYGAAAAAAAHMAWQLRAVDLDDRRDCMSKFVSNQWVGAIVFLGVVAGKLF